MMMFYCVGVVHVGSTPSAKLPPLPFPPAFQRENDLIFIVGGNLVFDADSYDFYISPEVILVSRPCCDTCRSR